MPATKDRWWILWVPDARKIMPHARRGRVNTLVPSDMKTMPSKKERNGGEKKREKRKRKKKITSVYRHIMLPPWQRKSRVCLQEGEFPVSSFHTIHRPCNTMTGSTDWA